MSSAGQAVGGVVGAVAGFFIGGPTGALYGAQLGMMAGGLIDPPKGPEIVGPRLDDLKVQTSTYGAPIPHLYGTIATAGNIFWLENNALKEVAKKKKSGGKGGPSTTTTTFSYYATFALGLCDCSDGSVVAGVRRIWCGADLIYDASKGDLESVLASNQASSLFTLHDGSLSQQPDARMQANIGVSNTPAYRGLAYLVFGDFPLEKYSNSLMAAQFKIEIVKSGYGQKQSVVAAIVKANGVKLETGDYPPGYPTSASKTFNDFTGRQWTMHGVEKSDAGFVNGYMVLDDYQATSSFSQSLVYSPAIDGQVIYGDFTIELTHNGLGGSVYGSSSFAMLASCSSSASAATLGSWVLFNGYSSSVGSHRTVCFEFMTAIGVTSLATALPSIPSTTDYTVRVERRSGIIRIYVDDVLRATQTTHAGDETPVSNTEPITIGNKYNLTYASGAYAPGRYKNFSVRRGSPLSQSSVPLASIIQSEVDLSNLISGSDIDVSALTQLVRGFRVTEVAAIRGAIEPLQAAWPFDVIQSGYKIIFKPRGSSSVVTIPADDLDARGAGDKTGISITNAREMDSVLPRRLVCNYLDVDREYDTGSQVDERLNTDAANTKTIEMPIVLKASECLGIVQTLLYMYWMERYAISFTLPSKYNQIEAGDVVTITADESIYSLRLTSITYTQDNRLECSARYANAAIYVHAAQAETGQSSGQVLTISGPSATVLLDIPLLLDTLDGPGFVVAMAGYMAGWPGGQLLRSDDQGQSWDSLQGFAKPGATIGSANNAIGSSQSGMIDKSSALLVGMIRGDLSSVTELAMLNGANYFAYGKHGRWEIIAAQNCTLQSDGSYLLTDLLRGQQGTEWASGLHAVGDEVILLDADLAFVSVNLNSIGQSRLYRGVTNGALVESASDKEFTYSGVNLECLSPCYLNGNRNAANDWSLTWIRRTRVGGALRDYVDASLGEASEQYEVDIFSDGTYTTVKRTITGLTTPAATYTSAQQVTDFGSSQTTLYVKIYQLSANVGRGYPLKASITR